MFTLTGGIYVAAASLIGFETLALVVAFSTAWPIAIPVVIVGLAAIHPVARLLGHRRAAE